MSKQSPAQKRQRGVILSSHGWERLQAVEEKSAVQDNAAKPYTLEQLSQRAGLSPNTLTKVRRRQAAVDRQTLECYFASFGLTLSRDDYTTLDFDMTLFIQQQAALEGSVPLGSVFYIDRPPAESLGYEKVLQPGALIRIKAPQQFGKTSLMIRILAHAQAQGYRTAVLSLQLADAKTLSDLSRFLPWFCAVATRNLNLPNQLSEYWDELFGSSYNCTNYFENYLLPATNSPLVLALDVVDTVFNYPETASDFFGMLRAWYEKAKYGSSTSEIWQRLRLIVVHSTEVYLPLNLNQSPFNVGLSIELPSFTPEQVQDLAQRYQLDDTLDCADKLIALVGGHPYLTQQALYHLTQQAVTLEQLVQTAIAPDSIFSNHLRKQLGNLQAYPDLLKAWQRVIFSPTPVELSPVVAFKLQSIGLVRLPYQQAVASCDLYRQYFARVLMNL